MNLKKILILIISFFFSYACADKNFNKIIKKPEKQYHSSKGFVLIYEDDHYNQKVVNKKIKNDQFIVMHSLLKRGTLIKVINPDNSKVIETKVSVKANFPKIFNAVISKKIASALELDLDNPYVEILELKKNKTFVAKEGTIFDEERNVADKAPVDEILMDDLSKSKTNKKKKTNKKSQFTLVISDFYYEASATELMNELIKKINIKNISVNKINNKKYRLLVGPFENFNALKTTYISLNNLGFENLNIYKK